MSALAIDLLRRAHASLEQAIWRAEAVADLLEDSQEGNAAAGLHTALCGSMDALTSIAGRVLMRTPTEPPRLSAECADEEPADLEDVEAQAAEPLDMQAGFYLCRRNGQPEPWSFYREGSRWKAMWHRDADARSWSSHASPEWRRAAESLLEATGVWVGPGSPPTKDVEARTERCSDCLSADRFMRLTAPDVEARAEALLPPGDVSVSCPSCGAVIALDRTHCWKCEVTP